MHFGLRVGIVLAGLAFVTERAAAQDTVQADEQLLKAAGLPISPRLRASSSTEQPDGERACCPASLAVSMRYQLNQASSASGFPRRLSR